MVQALGRQPQLSEDNRRFLFFMTLEDDTEDSPWMSMGDLQFWSATGFAYSLRNYAEERALPWFVAGMMPIRYTIPLFEAKKQLAPDVFVAFVPDHPRSSFDVDEEGGFPSFVLEVISPSSAQRDQVTKRQAYEMLGAREYALFTPNESGSSHLQGYRLNDQKHFDPWPLDEQGRLWSEVLGLYLIVRGQGVQAQTSEGDIVPTPRESEQRRREAESAARQAQWQAQQADEISRLALAENARLRLELERLREPPANT